MQANDLRAAFTRFFAARGHEVVPSASLIPYDPTVLFTIAGMVPFKPYFIGEEQPPWPRATSVQKCFRTVDIDIVGTTTRHGTFFEMLGNFSFGDYFKDQAIPYAWELLTEAFGIDGDRLWITVYETDDEAADIWRDAIGIPAERIQRMGEDNFWEMGETGPCGPCSEIYYDKGDVYGAPGGPLTGGAERFVEIWNLVFMQFNRQLDGSMEPLPARASTPVRDSSGSCPSSRGPIRSSPPMCWPRSSRPPSRSPGSPTVATMRPMSGCGSSPTTAGP